MDGRVTLIGQLNAVKDRAFRCCSLMVPVEYIETTQLPVYNNYFICFVMSEMLFARVQWSCHLPLLEKDVVCGPDEIGTF